MQEPSQNNQNNVDLNESVESIDLENLLNNTKDSAFDGNSSFEKILATQELNVVNNVNLQQEGETVEKYQPEVEDISRDNW